MKLVVISMLFSVLVSCQSQPVPENQSLPAINPTQEKLKYTSGIRTILEDSKGNLWIGNNGIGVLLFRDDRLINFSRNSNLIAPLSTLTGARSSQGTLEHVFAIAEDKDGNI